VSWAIPVSIAIVILFGVIVPWLFNFGRLFTSLYVVMGAVLGMIPVLAVMDKQHELSNRRQLLMRNSYVEGIGRLSYSELEHIVAAWYETLGYRVDIVAGSGDGGVDVWARIGSQRIAIQCKHWKTKLVGAKEVRELRGAVTEPHVDLVLVTSGRFSTQAVQDAKVRGVELVDGIDFLKRLDTVMADLAPSCPTCHGAMRLKEGRRGIFWSCVAYPNCKGSQDFAINGEG
jgi:restriction system protein